MDSIKVLRVVKFQGGIGNQLFQYALFLILMKRGYRTLADINEYSKIEMHSGFLIETMFDIKLDIVCENEIKLLKDYKENFLYQLKRRLLKKFKKTHLTRYSKNIVKIFNDSMPYYLDGYWQNEKFVKNYDEDIKLILASFRIENKNVDYIFEDIISSNSVAVHIRRGDYLSTKNRKTYYSCSKEYYINAIEEIKLRIDNPKFYLFSDDMNWVKQNFRNIDANLEFVNYDYSNKAVSDLFLMKSCKHQIIANSTYSWWAAFLNSHKPKIVVAPKYWLIDLNRDKNIFRPKDWLTIDNLENN